MIPVDDSVETGPEQVLEVWPSLGDDIVSHLWYNCVVVFNMTYHSFNVVVGRMGLFIIL